MSPDDPLDADALRAALGARLIGREITVLRETTSTNDMLFQMAPQTEEGFVLFAEHQTAGRGQHGKRWESAARKGLWFSVLLRPKIEPRESPRLTNWAAKTIAEALEEITSLRTMVKLPNDIYIQSRKVAGVLLEMRAVPQAPHLGILGVGLNVNQSCEDFPEELRESAGSLAMAVGRTLSRQTVALAVLRALDRHYATALAHG